MFSFWFASFQAISYQEPRIMFRVLFCVIAAESAAGATIVLRGFGFVLPLLQRKVRRLVVAVRRASVSCCVSDLAECAFCCIGTGLVEARLASLHATGKSALHREAKDAWDCVLKNEYHPSRTLLERLLLDEAAWPSFALSGDWRKLVDNTVEWEDLAALVTKVGWVEAADRLYTQYGLTPGAAMTLTGLVARISSEERVQGTAAVCIDPHLTLVFYFAVGSAQSIFPIRSRLAAHCWSTSRQTTP